LSFRTSSTAFPLSTVEFFQSALLKVEDTTYLGMSFILRPNSPVASSKPWPGCREPFVGDPAEELDVGLHQLLVLELVPFITTADPVGPAGVFVVPIDAKEVIHEFCA
jgi:hypothetical protein